MDTPAMSLRRAFREREENPLYRLACRRQQNAAGALCVLALLAIGVAAIIPILWASALLFGAPILAAVLGVAAAARYRRSGLLDEVRLTALDRVEIAVAIVWPLLGFLLTLLFLCGLAPGMGLLAMTAGGEAMAVVFVAEVFACQVVPAVAHATLIGVGAGLLCRDGVGAAVGVSLLTLLVEGTALLPLPMMLMPMGEIPNSPTALVGTAVVAVLTLRVVIIGFLWDGCLDLIRPSGWMP